MDFYKELEQDIRNAYESSPTIEEAEKLAAKFLAAQMALSADLKQVDLDSRMKKSGLKAIRAAVYLQKASEGDKKPSDVMLNAMVDSDPVVGESQLSFDKAEVSKNHLENYLSVFHEAHIYFRGLAKGRFE